MEDCQWLAELHQKHYDVLLRLARARLRPYAADAEDIVQQAFLLAASKDVRNHEAPLRWLMKTVGYLCMNHVASRSRALRKQQLCGAAAREGCNAENRSGVMAECEARMTLEQTLAEDEWLLLLRYCRQDTPLERLAAEYGLSPVALRVRIHRLRKKLKKEFYEV